VDRNREQVFWELNPDLLLHRLDDGLRATTLQLVGPAPPGAPTGPSRRGLGNPSRPGSSASRASSVAPSRNAVPPRSVAPPRSATGPSSVLSNVAGGDRKRVARPSSVHSGAARSQASGMSRAVSDKSRVSGAPSAAAMAARDKLAQIAAGLSPEQQQDLEAERARLVQLLLDPLSAAAAVAEIGGMVAAAQDAATAATTAAAPAAAATTLNAATTNPASNKAAATLRRLPAAPKIPDLASAHYVLDFGFATKGVNKARKVKITNTSMQQVGSKWAWFKVGAVSTLLLLCIQSAMHAGYVHDSHLTCPTSHCL
jgi:hypothetical protein